MMDFGTVAAISASGLEAERLRLDVSAINLANLHTTRTLQGGPFRPLRVVVGTRSLPPFSPVLQRGGDGILRQAAVLAVQQTNVAPRLVHDPAHPDANAKGFVAYPGVDSVTEMVNVMTAVRAYEANLAVLNAAKAMATRALQIGGAA
jgi:flagellar basal-body rod protein FlgC